MGRYSLAFLACLIVLGGCASPRVLESTDVGTTTIAEVEEQNPFVFEWGTPLKVTPVSDEIGAPPLPPVTSPGLPSTYPLDYPEAGTSGATRSGTGYVTSPGMRADEAPPAPPAVPSELAPDEDLSPSAVAFPPPAPCAPRLNCCKKMCPCGKKAAGQCGCGKAQGRGGCCKKRCYCGRQAAGKGGNCCRSCPCPDPCGNPCGGFVGGNLSAGPGFGGAVEFGMNFKRTRTALWSWEFSMGYQDFYDEISGGDQANAGKMRMFRAGVRARFKPCCKLHPTLRAGIGWVNVTGAPETLDLAEIDGEGDYFGGYLGVGLEYDLSARWSTGPELAIFGGLDAEGDTAVVPSILWHLNYRF